MDAAGEILAEPSSDADSLVSRNEPDDLANEQTWPTEEEMRRGEEMMDEADESEAKQAAKMKKLPKGTSSYQAAWIVDEEDEVEGDDGDDEGDDDEEGDEEMPDTLTDRGVNGFGTEEAAPSTNGMDMDSRKSEVHFDLDEEEEEQQYEDLHRTRGTQAYTF